MFTDAHAHPFDLFSAAGREPDITSLRALCASSHGREEFLWNEAFARRNRSGAIPDNPRECRVLLSFGVHPQLPAADTLPFLSELARDGRIAAVGEAGFDLFNEGFRGEIIRQQEVWAAQLEIARTYGLPLIVHCRKAMHLIFSDGQALKALPSVVFHGWPGSPAEAKALLRRGVNAWFSAGKGLLRGDRSLISTVRELEPERILAETDAPWMTLRGEAFTTLQDIKAVHASISSLWGIPLEDTASRIELNFRKALESPR